MTPLISSPAAEVVSERQKHALLKLLADDDPEVHRTIRERILSMGGAALPWLRAHWLSEDAVLRRRVHEIVVQLARQSADNRFLAFCLNHGDDLDLEEGVWLLACTEYPLINVDGYRALLDDFARRLRERITAPSQSEYVLSIFRQFLFKELGFSGNEQNYYEPENSYFNRVLDRRTGNPVSLCLIYLLLGRRLGLPLAGIAMPGHFLARFQNSTGELYVDAFNQGKLLTKADCIRYLAQTNHGFQEGVLSPVSPLRVLLRACSNLHQIYQKLGAVEHTARFQRYIVALAK